MEIQILSRDKPALTVPLERDRLMLGRAPEAELCFPDAVGLSKKHLLLERDGSEWTVRDLGSRNSTKVNGRRISEARLKPGDRIDAGPLVLLYGTPSQRAIVVFEPPGEEESTSSSTMVTKLSDVISGDGSAEAAERVAHAHVIALTSAGHALRERRPLPELFQRLLDLSIEAVSAERGILMTLEEGELVVGANRGQGFRISPAVRDRVLNEHASVLVRDTALDNAFRDRPSITDARVRTLMAVPLQTGEEIIGLIYVDSPSLTCRFTKDDLSLLTVMANIAAIRIEHNRWEAIEEARLLMERDLQQAAEIQRRFLPAKPPEVPGLDLAGHNVPCRTVGGDYYDFFPYPNGRVAMVLGDVSGKGMPASLLMMGLSERVQVLIDEPEELAAVVMRINRITTARCPPDRFITFFCCVIDPANGDVVYCNAGHNRPFLVRADGTYELLDSAGLVLGVRASVQYEEHRCRLNRGDMLMIYSDGVTEAANAAEEEFEMSRLAEVLCAHRDDPAEMVVAEVSRAVAAFTAGAAQSDDITMIAVKRTAYNL